MSWATLPPELRELAERELTPGQLDAIKLYDAGYGYQRVGIALGIGKEAARDRIRRGLERLRKAATKAGLEA